MAELKDALNSGKFGFVEEEKEKEIELNSTSLAEAWAELLLNKEGHLPSNFISNAKGITPILESDKNVVITLFSSVAKGFISEQGSEMKSFFRNYFNQSDINLNINLEIDESNEPIEKKYLNPKEQFEALSKENPALESLRKKFDLDIDYDHK